MSARPFSILLPDGKRTGSRPTLFGALFEARNVNRSRAARDLPLVRVLDRDTGRTWDVAPDADIMAIEAAA